MNDSRQQHRPTVLLFKKRFTLRTLLLIGAVVAAFLSGWMAHRNHIRQTYQDELSKSQELKNSIIKAAQGARQQRVYTIDETMMMTDRLDHEERLRRLSNKAEELLRD